MANILNHIYSSAFILFLNHLLLINHSQSKPQVPQSQQSTVSLPKKGKLKSSQIHQLQTEKIFTLPYKQTMNKTMRWEFLKTIESDESEDETIAKMEFVPLQKQEKK